jgi:carbamoylphosphate synthase large subunit
VRIWGTQPDAIDEAEDRDRWMELLTRLDIKQPARGGIQRGGSVREWEGEAPVGDSLSRLGNSIDSLHAHPKPPAPPQKTPCTPPKINL